MNNIKSAIAVSFIIGLFLLGSAGISLSKEDSPVVNLMIDADINHSPTADQTTMAGNTLINLTNEIDPNLINATIFVTEDIASAYRLGITQQGTNLHHELALHGNATDEKLSTMSDADQKTLLTNAYNSLYHCYVCGGKHVDIKGFRPQAFDQNNATFSILENQGIVYDAGFQAGAIYVAGHDKDTWPYIIEGHNLYAVPVSTYMLNGERVYLYDRYIRDTKKLSSDQWYNLLTEKLDESAKNGEPMVVIFSNLVSGSGDYLDAYRNFIQYAMSKGANFVTTMQLVDMAAAKNPAENSSAIISASKVTEKINKSEVGAVKGCPTCDQTAIGVARSMINVTIIKNKNCTTCNQSLTNSTK